MPVDETHHLLDDVLLCQYNLSEIGAGAGRRGRLLYDAKGYVTDTLVASVDDYRLSRAQLWWWGRLATQLRRMFRDRRDALRAEEPKMEPTPCQRQENRVPRYSTKAVDPAGMTRKEQRA